MSLDVYHENGDPYISNSEYKSRQLDNEIREHLKKQIRMLEIDDSRFDNEMIDKEFEKYYIGED